MSDVVPDVLAGGQFALIAPGEKACRIKGWPNIRPSLDEVERHIARGGNLAMRLGAHSADIVDVDLDCLEALALADIYLPSTGAEFGRPSAPRSHRLYLSPGAAFATFADPLDGTMLAELRADGRDGGAHLTLIPPSIADGERRAWHGDIIEPAAVDAAVLARRCGWLAVGCLTMRHLSEYAARRPGPDLPAVLWEADRALGRTAYRWLGERAPDDPVLVPKHRRELSQKEIDLAELVAAIPNDLDWTSWNRLGLAIYAASNGSNEGAIVFDDFSAKSPKYNPYITAERWRNYRRCPPSRIGAGSLIYLARQHGWQGGA